MTKKVENKAVHIQMQRLYIATKELKGIKGQAGLALHLGAVSQTVNNWEARGISKDGMIKAQRLIGCSALWLETGEGAMVFGELPESAKENPEAVKVTSAKHEDQDIQAVIELMETLDVRGRIFARGLLFGSLISLYVT